MHIVGTTMDFVEDELASEFVFHNPNAKVRTYIRSCARMLVACMHSWHPRLRVCAVFS